MRRFVLLALPPFMANLVWVIGMAYYLPHVRERERARCEANTHELLKQRERETFERVRAAYERAGRDVDCVVMEEDRGSAPGVSWRIVVAPRSVAAVRS